MAKLQERTPEQIEEFERLPKEEQDRQREKILRAIEEDPEVREQFIELILPGIAEKLAKKIMER
jgi:hypothetical protein